MLYRIFSFFFVLLMMIIALYTDFFSSQRDIHPTLVLGFLLLTAYHLGFFGSILKMPRITGYMIAGLLFGPYFLKFIDQQALNDLEFLNGLALAFIAFCAGAELKLESIKQKLKVISFMLVGITLIGMIGVTLCVFFIAPWVPFLKPYPWQVKLAVAAIFGVISTARSPSSAIAIINETRSKGPFTDIVLSVTVATDVVVIMLFAVVISLCQLLVSPDGSFSMGFAIDLSIEIVVAFALGYLLGKAIIFLIVNLEVELPVVIGGMGFLVLKFCHLLSEYLHHAHDISLHLEPLLICMAAGFTVQNCSEYGDKFIHSMDKVSLPIYVAFFAIAGASINMDSLRTGWILGLVVFFARLVTIYLGAYISGRMAGEEPMIYKESWWGLITQAGVSLGLLAEVVRRFPEVGIHVQSILIASITLNQVIGPVAFKYVLGKVGEARL